MQDTTTQKKQGLLSRYGEKALRIITRPITRRIDFTRPEDEGKPPQKRIDHEKIKKERIAKTKMQERYKSRSGWDYVAY